jgi:hypothetical protein
MKRLAKGVAVLSMVFSIALFAGCGGKKESGAPAGGAAGDVAKPENPITANKTGIFELEGEVSNINTVSNTFTLKTAEGDVEVYVRAMSRIMVDGERQSLSGLKSGSYAKGTFKKWDGKDTVMEIVITPGK